MGLPCSREGPATEGEEAGGGKRGAKRQLARNGLRLVLELALVFMDSFAERGEWPSDIRGRTEEEGREERRRGRRKEQRMGVEVNLVEKARRRPEQKDLPTTIIERYPKKERTPLYDSLAAIHGLGNFDEEGERRRRDREASQSWKKLNLRGRNRSAVSSPLCLGRSPFYMRESKS